MEFLPVLSLTTKLATRALNKSSSASPQNKARMRSFSKGLGMANMLMGGFGDCDFGDDGGDEGFDGGAENFEEGGYGEEQHGVGEEGVGEQYEGGALLEEEGGGEEPLPEEVYSGEGCTTCGDPSCSGECEPIGCPTCGDAACYGECIGEGCVACGDVACAGECTEAGCATCGNTGCYGECTGAGGECGCAECGDSACSGECIVCETCGNTECQRDCTGTGCAVCVEPTCSGECVPESCLTCGDFACTGECTDTCPNECGDPACTGECAACPSCGEPTCTGEYCEGCTQCGASSCNGQQCQRAASAQSRGENSGRGAVAQQGRRARGTLGIRGGPISGVTGRTFPSGATPTNRPGLGNMIRGLAQSRGRRSAARGRGATGAAEQSTSQRPPFNKFTSARGRGAAVGGAGATGDVRGTLRGRRGNTASTGRGQPAQRGMSVQAARGRGALGNLSSRGENPLTVLRRPPQSDPTAAQRGLPNARGQIRGGATAAKVRPAQIVSASVDPHAVAYVYSAPAPSSQVNFVRYPAYVSPVATPVTTYQLPPGASLPNYQQHQPQPQQVRLQPDPHALYTRSQRNLNQLEQLQREEAERFQLLKEEMEEEEERRKQEAQEEKDIVEKEKETARRKQEDAVEKRKLLQGRQQAQRPPATPTAILPQSLPGSAAETNPNREFGLPSISRRSSVMTNASTVSSLANTSAAGPQRLRPEARFSVELSNTQVPPRIPVSARMPVDGQSSNRFNATRPPSAYQSHGTPNSTQDQTIYFELPHTTSRSQPDPRVPITPPSDVSATVTSSRLPPVELPPTPVESPRSTLNDPQTPQPVQLPIRPNPNPRPPQRPAGQLLDTQNVHSSDSITQQSPPPPYSAHTQSTMIQDPNATGVSGYRTGFLDSLEANGAGSYSARPFPEKSSTPVSIRSPQFRPMHASTFHTSDNLANLPPGHGIVRTNTTVVGLVNPGYQHQSERQNTQGFQSLYKSNSQHIPFPDPGQFQYPSVQREQQHQQHQSQQQQPNAQRHFQYPQPQSVVPMTGVVNNRLQQRLQSGPTLQQRTNIHYNPHTPSSQFFAELPVDTEKPAPSLASRTKDGPGNHPITPVPPKRKPVSNADGNESEPEIKMRASIGNFFDDGPFGWGAGPVR